MSAIWLAGAIASSGTVDLNGDGMSAIWEWTYSTTNLNPNADPDGDGFSNLLESIAGTDPFDSNSYPHSRSGQNHVDGGRFDNGIGK